VKNGHTPGELQRAWAVLSAPRTAALSSYPLDVTAGALACRVALDGAGLRHLLVPAPGEILAPDRRPSVLSSSVRALTFDREMTTYVDIWCNEPDLHAEFDDVIDDLLDAVDGAAAPGATALAGLSRWRRLFRTRLMRGLSAEARIGLFAELTVLRALFDSEPSLPVEVWTGPLGQPHDFETPIRCLEIKATGPHHEPIAINGIEQLDTHDGRPLELLILTVLPDPEGTTLTELIDIVRLATGGAGGFGQRLQRLGWQPDPLTIDTDAFVVGEMLRVPITDSTPRLVPASLAAGALPDGVSDLSYRLDRDALTAHAAQGTLAEIAAEAVR
jgi:hypothetical protein